MPPSARARWPQAAAVLVILGIATGLRLLHLGRHGYQLDEMWAAEVAVGNGSVHQHMPADVVMDPPRWFDPRHAPPVWRVWFNIDVTHPPLYSILLRLWEDVFGDGDVAGRSLSVCLGVAGVGVLIDTVRRAMGWPVAVWAGLLSAVSCPLVDYGRETRNYALMVLTATIVANLIVRIGTLGPNRRRVIGLAAAVFATLLSHYFTVGFIAAMAVYSGLAFRGQLRAGILSAIAAGTASFAAVWGPFAWRQRRLSSTSDPSTLFLRDDVPHHIASTIQRVCTTPVRVLFEPHGSGFWIAAGGAVLFILPWMLVRRRPWIGLFAAWMTGAVAFPAALDFTRGTAHLFYIRYVLLAAPAVCVLWPAVPGAVSKPKPPGRARPGPTWVGWEWIIVPVVIGCLAGLPEVYNTWQADPAEVRNFVAPRWTAEDLVVFAAGADDLSSAGVQYMMADRYLRPIPCRVLFLTGPPTGDAAAAVAGARRVWFFTDGDSWRPFLPNLTLPAKTVPTRVFPGRGIVFELRR